jgi:hypothetical protein
MNNYIINRETDNEVEIVKCNKELINNELQEEHKQLVDFFADKQDENRRVTNYLLKHKEFHYLIICPPLK